MKKSADFAVFGKRCLFRSVDFAQFLEQSEERCDDLLAQRCVVFAHERAVVRLGRVHRLGEELVAQSDGLLHHTEDLLLLRGLEADRHIAVENDLLEAVVDLLFQGSQICHNWILYFEFSESKDSEIYMINEHSVDFCGLLRCFSLL